MSDRQPNDRENRRDQLEDIEVRMRAARAILSGREDWLQPSMIGARPAFAGTHAPEPGNSTALGGTKPLDLVIHHLVFCQQVIRQQGLHQLDLCQQTPGIQNEIELQAMRVVFRQLILVEEILHRQILRQQTPGMQTEAEPKLEDDKER